MSVETYYKQGPIRENLESSRYSSILKTLVSDLLALDPMLSLHSVVIDTTSVYSCYLKISDSNLLIKIENNSSIVQIYRSYIKSSGEIVDSNYSNVFFFNEEDKCCAISWGLGDCIRYFSLVSSSGACISLVYSFMNTETYSKKIICYCQGSTTGNSFPVPKVNQTPDYFYNYEFDSVQSMAIFSFAPNNATKNSGYNYILFPFSYMGYSVSYGFLNITFGEGHKLYRLYNGNDVVVTNPGVMVTIDGKQIMSVGQIYYAE